MNSPSWRQLSQQSFLASFSAHTLFWARCMEPIPLSLPLSSQKNRLMARDATKGCHAPSTAGTPKGMRFIYVSMLVNNNYCKWFKSTADCMPELVPVCKPCSVSQDRYGFAEKRCLQTSNRSLPFKGNKEIPKICSSLRLIKRDGSDKKSNQMQLTFRKASAVR